MKTIRILAFAAAMSVAAVPQVSAESADELSARVVQLYQQGKIHEAIPIAEKVVELRKVHEKEEPAEFATSLNNLAWLYQDMGDYAKAEPLYQHALAIREKVLGPEHPDTAQSLNQLSYNQFLFGKAKEALGHASQAESAYRSIWANLLRFTSERQREAALGTLGNLDLCGTLGDGPLTARSLLWRKGALLDSLVEERRLATAAGANKELAEQFKKAENLKNILRRALMEGNKVKLSKESIAQHQSELDVLQKTIAVKVGGLGEARHSLECSVEQVQAAIPNGTVLVDFMRYGHALGKGKQEERYAAVLVMSDKDPVFVSLGRAEAIETALARHRKLVGSPSAEETSARDTELETTCKELHKWVGAPIEAVLPPDTTELILCPDGPLHFLAFSSLMNPEGKLWAENFNLRNISTASDLLKLARPPRSEGAKTVVLVGNPDFRDATPISLFAEGVEARDREERDHLALNLTHGGLNEKLRGLDFRALQGTAVEVAGLKTRFEKHGWKTTLLTGPEASETAVVAAVDSPEILHLATHGYFVDELDLGQKKARERQGMNQGLDGEALRLRAASRDPMLRSGLALSGAQSTRSLWENGKIPPLDKDGILTAAEVANLRLQGTRLVTLSASESGLGVSKNGEGVLGLGRALTLAGAENLLLTLWSIGDADTIALMAAFYDRVLAGEHPARALVEVQREALTRLRKEKGLWHAINRAAPFVIVSNTAIPATAETSNDQSTAAPRVHALLVGGSITKDHQWPRSLGAGRDCDDFEALLRDRFNIPASQITKLTGVAVTNEAFTKALTKIMLEDARSGDTVIFFYSGLSLRVPDLDGDETGSEADVKFIAYDSDLADPSKGITDDTLVSLLSKCKAANRLIVLDTCCAAGFADGFVELSPDKPKGGNSAPGDHPRTLFLAGCGKEQVCRDVPGDRLPVPQKETRGIFTYYLTRTLREVSPDLALTHLAAVVKSTVAAFTTVGGKTAQNPVLLGNVGLDEEIGTFFGKAPVR